jgi:hypothetical protein
LIRKKNIYTETYGKETKKKNIVANELLHLMLVGKFYEENQLFMLLELITFTFD